MDRAIFKTVFVISAFAAAWLAVSCCGYSTRSLLPSHIKRIHIRLFENNTLKPGLDEKATLLLTDAFRSGSGLRVVGESNADIVLEGRIVNYDKFPYTYTGDRSYVEYRVAVSLNARCVDREKNEVFWEGTISDWVTYTDNEDQAIDAAIKKAAEKMVNAILTNW